METTQLALELNKWMEQLYWPYRSVRQAKKLNPWVLKWDKWDKESPGKTKLFSELWWIGRVNYFEKHDNTQPIAMWKIGNKIKCKYGISAILRPLYNSNIKRVYIVKWAQSSNFVTRSSVSGQTIIFNKCGYAIKLNAHEKSQRGATTVLTSDMEKKTVSI